MFKLNLIFPDETECIDEAKIDIWVEDQSEADAPAARLASATVEAGSIHQPSIYIQIEPDRLLLQNEEELAVMVKVRGVDQCKEPVFYLNTESTRFEPCSAESSDADPIRVLLSRVV